MPRFYIGGVLTTDNDDMDAEEVADIVIDAANNYGLTFAGGVQTCVYGDLCQGCAAADGCAGYSDDH